MRLKDIEAATAALKSRLVVYADDRCSAHPDEAERLCGVMEAFNNYVEALERYKNETPRLPGKMNSVSRKVFLRDDCKCWVCGLRDPSGGDLRRVGLRSRDNDVDTSITLCEDCAGIYRELAPWRTRDDEGELTETAIRAMLKMVENNRRFLA